MSPSRLSRASDLARHWVEDQGLQTMVVLVARRGVIVLHRAFGRMGPEPAAPPTPLNAVFELQSITKVFTATALMTLVDEGRVGLNRPVSTYIPEFQGEGKDAVLVRNLLSHTSGLSTSALESYAREMRGKVPPPTTPDTAHPLWYEALALRFGCPLWKPPGTEMSYSSYNLSLAAEIVRRVSGMPLDRFARDRIFGPLGMKDSFYCLVDVPRERRVTGTNPPDYILDATDRARERERFWSGAWGALSSAMDAAIFGQMFLNGGSYGDARVLSPAAASAMTRNQTPKLPAVFFDQVFPESSWGLGWGVEGGMIGWNGALQSPRAYGHIGNGGVHVWVDPDYELVCACFSVTQAFVTSEDYATPNWARRWRNDLFADAVSACVEDP